MFCRNWADGALTSLNDLKIEGSCISAGHFGNDYKAEHRVFGVVVCKKLDVKYISDEDKKNLTHEAGMRIQLRHPSIQTFVGIVLEPENYGLVLEYMRYGDIVKFNKDYDVEWGWKLQMSYDIVLGMNYLHTQIPAITHGCLTSNNILIGEGFKAKISECGFPTWRLLSRTDSERNGSHIPPEERLPGCEQQNELDDALDFGVLLWEVLSNRKPNNGESVRSEISTLVRRGERPQMSHIANDNLKEIIIDCWSQNAEGRPSFFVLKDRFEKLCSRHKEEIVKAKQKLYWKDQQLNKPISPRTPQNSTPQNSGRYFGSLESDSFDHSVDGIQIIDDSGISDTEVLQNDEIKEEVINNYVRIVNDIDVKGVCDKLYQEKILTEYQRKKIDTPQKPNIIMGRMLLDELLSKRNPDAFVEFYKALENTQPHLAELIRERKRDKDETDGRQRQLVNHKLKHRFVDICHDVIDNVDPEEVIDLLFQERILTLEEKQKILKKTTDETWQDGCRELFSFLIFLQSDRAFIVFRQALVDCGSWLVPKKLDAPES